MKSGGALRAAGLLGLGSAEEAERRADFPLDEDTDVPVDACVGVPREGGVHRRVDACEIYSCGHGVVAQHVSNVRVVV